MQSYGTQVNYHGLQSLSVVWLSYLRLLDYNLIIIIFNCFNKILQYGIWFNGLQSHSPSDPFSCWDAAGYASAALQRKYVLQHCSSSPSPSSLSSDQRFISSASTPWTLEEIKWSWVNSLSETTLCTYCAGVAFSQYERLAHSVLHLYALR
jgi:hypothetical protein